jgi:hypothetical protein
LWVGHVQGILENWFPGQVDGDAIAPILFGDVDPSGRLPVTFPVQLSDDPLQTAAQYPGVSEPGDTVGPHPGRGRGAAQAAHGIPAGEPRSRAE